jgi:uncharacterized metal-binding protein
MNKFLQWLFKKSWALGSRVALQIVIVTLCVTEITNPIFAQAGVSATNTASYVEDTTKKEPPKDLKECKARVEAEIDNIITNWGGDWSIDTETGVETIKYVREILMEQCEEMFEPSKTPTRVLIPSVVKDPTGGVGITWPNGGVSLPQIPVPTVDQINHAIELANQGLFYLCCIAGVFILIKVAGAAGVGLAPVVIIVGIGVVLTGGPVFAGGGTDLPPVSTPQPPAQTGGQCVDGTCPVSNGDDGKVDCNQNYLLYDDKQCAKCALEWWNSFTVPCRMIKKT